MYVKSQLQWNLSTKAMLGVKSFDPCREFGCFQSLFFIVVDHCGPFTLAVVKSQVVLRSPFVERFHCIPYDPIERRQLMLSCLH